MKGIQAYLTEWESTQKPSRLAIPDRQIQCLTWHKPMSSKRELNMDATFFHDTQQTGVGMILRDEQGEFITMRTVVKEGCATVDIGEALGFYEVLSWLKDMEI
ncbi:hypothetical protein ACS0TY_036060 [Phlomoides rotata]